MGRHCAICDQTFPTEQFPSRRGANEALNYHLQNYHLVYYRWVWRVWSRLPVIFLAALIMDFLVFNSFRNSAPLVGPIPWPSLAVIVLLELAVVIWLMRTIYRRKVGSVRLEWQEHPVPISQDRESSDQSMLVTDGSGASASSIEPGEKYLGGFYSLQLGLGWGRNQTVGYGIYATNRRLFGVSHVRPSFEGTMALIPQNLPDEDNNRIISELARLKQLEVGTDRVAKIDLEIPKGVFRTGHLEIILGTGERVDIRVGRKRPGEQLRDLLQIFAPNALTVS